MSELVSTWVNGYRKAWQSNTEEDIRALFTEDAVYEFRPNDPKPWAGLDAIVAGWLASPEAPGSTTWEWHPIATEGSIATIQGVTTYLEGVGEGSAVPTVYDNLWVITLEPDGRASHFTEWYMERKAAT
jgi:SnoaL-like protein